jgi:hypothetical protein
MAPYPHGMSRPLPSLSLCLHAELLNLLRDALLQRYQLLLGRITALSEYISRPTPTQPLTLHSTTASSEPALSKYIIHPLNPLPADANPLAGDTFFQALNTLPLPAVDPVEQKARFKGMKEEETVRVAAGLRGRLKREDETVKGILGEVERISGEMDWELRIEDDLEGEVEGEDGVQGQEAGGKEKEKADEDYEDLFGDSEDDDVVMVDPPSKPLQNEPSSTERTKLLNPREGWTVTDYVVYMDSGRQPP